RAGLADAQVAGIACHATARIAFVNHAIAVIVNAVAHLSGRCSRRATLGNTTYAILYGALTGAGTACGRAQSLVDKPIAVVVDPITNLQAGTAGDANASGASPANAISAGSTSLPNWATWTGG